MTKGKHKAMAERRAEVFSVEKTNQELLATAAKYEKKISELTAEIRELKVVHAERIRALNTQIENGVSDHVETLHELVKNLKVELGVARTDQKRAETVRDNFATKIFQYLQSNGLSEREAMETLHQWSNAKSSNSKVVGRGLSSNKLRKMTNLELRNRLIEAKS
jgi:hypothetical protein